MSEIQVSVIIPSYNSRDTIKKCLRSLEDQKGRGTFEVIVVDSSDDGVAELVAQFPTVRLYTFSERKFPGDARNFGTSKAKGDILAFTDADCIVDQNWINSIIEAHNRYPERPLIGGSIDNGNPQSYVGWAYYFCRVTPWMPGSRAGLLMEIPTSCLSVKRWAFDRYGPFLEGGYSSDTAFNWRAVKDGYKPLFVPSIKVSHINIERLTRSLKKQVAHGKQFATIRMSEQKFSVIHRTTYVMLSPLLPFLLSYRTTKSILNTGTYRKQFLLSFPLVFLGLLMWSLGEFLGYVSNSE